jgi:uncharacterized protein HemX
MKLNKDLIKTGGAVLLIAVIVVATFLYGNSQRQEQVRKDQAAKQEQERKANEEQTAQNTAQPADDNTAASATPTQTSASTPSPSKTPSTGGELGYLIPATALLVGYRMSRRSKQAVLQALRSR